MATQKNANLDEFLDEKAPPTLYFSKLTPELANAALNLAIDFGRRSQAPAIKAIASHPISVTTILLSISGYAYYNLWEFYRRGGLSLIAQNLDSVVAVLVFSTAIVTIFFVLGTFLTSVIRDRADNITKDTCPVFGLDLTRLAVINPANKKLDKESKEILATAENTSVALYRETPIALVSVQPVDSLSNKDKFVTKITGLGIRKVYQKSGILEDLIDWSVFRSGVLNNNKADKILILIEVLSTDQETKKVLQAKRFQHITTKKLDASDMASNFGLASFGINVEIYGIALNVKSLGKDGDLASIKSILTSKELNKKDI